jgi:peptide-methionine (R)-S-oxide reductase
MSSEMTKTDEEWQKELTPAQYQVLRHAGTEPAFTGEYWDCHDDGVYRCAACGAELFTSDTKFESGTGWPSFTKPIEPQNVVENPDNSHGMMRTEVRSSNGDSHLGHLFPDGPRAEGGLRYCINSASLRFVHLKDLEKEGYGAYRKLFALQEKE